MSRLGRLEIDCKPESQLSPGKPTITALDNITFCTNDTRITSHQLEAFFSAFSAAPHPDTNPWRMRLRFFHCILTLSTFISLATSDVYPDNIPAQTQYPNCGTIENVFKMGTLLKKTASRGVCRELRWPGGKVDVREGCLCAFYRYVGTLLSYGFDFE